MKRPLLEVADILRCHGAAFMEKRGSSLSAQQKRVLHDIVACRTQALGGHLEKCDRCGFEHNAYNSCRNRHCPKCQAGARAKWLEERRKDLLPVEYHHVVFTLMEEIDQIALQNKKVIYDMLFQASSETLKQIAGEAKHSGAEIGFFGVLHTWGQVLLHHAHVHYVVPGGGLAPDGSKWISCAKGFFLPVKILSRVFRGKFLEKLKKAYRSKEIAFHGSLAHLNDPKTFSRLLNQAYKKEWVVYSKPPFGGPEQVLKYLARYTHRVAISNSRLVSMKDGKVTFQWKDYAKEHANRLMTLNASEFIRRFLLHVLPNGFMRIRHYGFLSNRSRKTKIALCLKFLEAENEESQSPFQDTPMMTQEDPSEASVICPQCKKGSMIRMKKLKPMDSS